MADFISQWTTTAPGQSITLPLVSSGTYNFTVDWGDESNGTVTAWDDADKTHTYASADTYTVTISGTINQWSFGADPTSKLKITNISQWGDLQPGATAGDQFSGCTNLTVTATDALDTTGMTNMRRMFDNCDGLTSMNMSAWDVSAITNMQEMFDSASNLASVTITGWNTSSLTNTSYMFRDCTSLATITGLSDLDTGNVTTMTNMFYGCDSLISLDLSAWDVSKVTTMASMFAGSASLASVNVSNWAVTSSCSMADMFSGCSALSTFTCTDWDTSGVTLMRRMFINCNSLTTMDLSSWDVSAVANMQEMFEYCGGLTSVDASGCDVSAVTNMSYMFRGCTSLTAVDVTGWNINKVTTMVQMFSGDTLTTDSYSAFIEQCMANAPPHASVTLDGGSSKYWSGAPAAARGLLTGTYGWTITDGGILNLPGKATNPSPADDGTGISASADCSWDSGGYTDSYDVYWGASASTLTRRSAGQAGTSYDPGTLLYDRTYYWRIDSVNAYGTTTGDIWSFTTAAEPLPVIQDLAPVFFPPQVPFAETLSFFTNILGSRDGSEQRIAHHAGIPRQRFMYPLFADSQARTVRLQHLLHAYLKSAWPIPIWAEMTRCKSVRGAGAASIALDTSNADYRSGSRALIYETPENAEILRIDTVSANSLSLVTNTVNSYGNPHFVMPCRIGNVLAAARRELFEGGGSITELTLEATDNVALTGYTPALTYDGLEVITEPSRYFGEGWAQSHDPRTLIVDARTGAVERVSLSDYNAVTQDHGWCNDTAAKAWQFRLWLHYVVGMQKSFLVPTMRPDFVFTQAVGSADTSIYVQNRAFAALNGNSLETYLAFRPVGATIIPRKITGMLEVSAAEEVIALDAAPGVAFAAGRNACWLHQCRLAADAAQLDWQSAGQNLVQAQFERVEQ